ncbi:MBL fold metallo-hydrolase [Ferrovibrio sp.]|uniref:MBL fold metallo-hydrolase n=1 Tax=Ferrovibrio sp. TaxID=1917215 RepID=UPI003D0AD0FF
MTIKSATLAALLLSLSLLLGACMPSPDAPQAEGKPYHHLADGRFRNPPGSPPRTAGFSDFAPFLLGQFVRSFDPPVPPPGHVLNPAEVQAGRAALAGQDHITWLGHAAFLMRLNGATLITDPYLATRAGPYFLGPQRYVPSALGVEQLPPLDLLLVSHNHYDHLDERTVEALPHKERVTVIVPLKLGAFFRERGYANVVELDWYDSTERNGLKVTAVPAVHFSRRTLFDTNRTLWAGFIIEGGGKRVYFSGDTAYGAAFKEIGNRFAPVDLALIGIGAYEPQAIMKATHATPEEAVLIGRDIGARRLVGMHWGTVVLTQEPAFEAAPRFRAAGGQAGYAPDAVLPLKIGESLGF